MSRQFFCLIVSVLLIFVSCREDDVNSKIRGKWQLKTVEQAGGIVTSVDTVWYNFQSASLFMYQLYYAEKDTFIHWYGYKVQPEEYKVDLAFELVSVFNPNLKVEEFLPYTDWEGSMRSFTVEKVTSKNLILNGDNKIYSFKKFE